MSGIRTLDLVLEHAPPSIPLAGNRTNSTYITRKQD
jgi:hypothetical protein